MATVKDVAREAEVSVGTVSKVLSKDPTVKVALRERVYQAVKELDYRPNLVARALRTNTINTLGLVLPDIANPFFAQLAKDIEAEARKIAHTVMLANSNNDPDIEVRQVEALLNQFPRGLIVVGSTNRSSNEVQTSVPIISIDRRYCSYGLVSTNHEVASAMVAKHLIELGHRKIVYISGPQSTEVGKQRCQGFCNEIDRQTDSNIVLSVVEGKFDYDSGESLARKILQMPGDFQPTAIAAASDQQAIGVLRAARDLGVDVPSMISVTGFDDIALAHLYAPRLTTVSQRTDELARIAVQQIVNEDTDISADNYVQADLIIRGSTGPAV